MSLRAFPQVVHAGMPTRGALSDILSKNLDEGWSLNLSNAAAVAVYEAWRQHGFRGAV